MDFDLESLTWRLRSIVGEDNLREHEPMSEHTTFQIGGPADVFVCPETPEELSDCISACKEAQVPYMILGLGSDLLVGDKGIRGVVISLSEGMVGVTAEGRRLVCQAGVPIIEASNMACELGLSGLEFACGIPGSVGGAVFMNAGAYDGQVKDVLESVRVIDAEGNISNLNADELNLSYRHSRLQEEELYCVSATFLLEEADQDKIRAKMEDLTERRESKQPLDMPSAGSTFKRPEGHFTGKLIIDAGLQGTQIGGAQVSTKHAGFLVNTGGATADDVHALIEHIQDVVEKNFGVHLEPEVRFIGER